jgi:hypothetical protein
MIRLVKLGDVLKIWMQKIMIIFNNLKFFWMVKLNIEIKLNIDRKKNIVLKLKC